MGICIKCGFEIMKTKKKGRPKKICDRCKMIEKELAMTGETL